MSLQKNHANAATLVLVRQVTLIHTTTDGRSPPVVEIVMQLPVTSTEFQGLEEERVILQCQSIEDVELCLWNNVSKGRVDGNA